MQLILSNRYSGRPATSVTYIGPDKPPPITVFLPAPYLFTIAQDPLGTFPLPRTPIYAYLHACTVHMYQCIFKHSWTSSKRAGCEVCDEHGTPHITTPSCPPIPCMKSKFADLPFRLRISHSSSHFISVLLFLELNVCEKAYSFVL